MASLTENALNVLDGVLEEPKLVFEFEGIDNIYSATAIQEIVRIGDEIEIGDFIIGGYTEIPNQESIISFQNTSAEIRTKLEPDKARSTSVASMKVRFIDIDEKATQLISPTVVTDDIMFTRVVGYIGFGNSTSFPEDYIPFFKGFVDDIVAGQGWVDLNFSTTDQKKRTDAFPKVETTLPVGITDSVSVIEIKDASELVEVPVSPATNARDNALLTYIVINDEIIQYESKGTAGGGPNGGTLLLNCTRGEFSTTASAHSADDDVKSFYKLEGNTLDLALKVMLSDRDLTPYATVTPTSVNEINTLENIQNIFYILENSFTRKYNVKAGDFIKSSGFSEASNNLTDYVEVIDVVDTTDGSYILVSETDINGSPVVLTTETDTSGQIEITSQYNTLGEGLKMVSDDVDIDQHLLIKQRFLSNADQRFYLKDTIEDVKEFIALQLYRPFAAYEVPRGARSSVSYTIGPIPSDNIQILNKSNIRRPETISLKRSSGKFYYKAVAYKYETETDLDSERFLKGTYRRDLSSLGREVLVIEAEGLREEFDAENLTTQATDRFLDRYRNGAEYLNNIHLAFKEGMQIDVGDIVLFDPTDLNVANTVAGTREKPETLYEVINKSINIKTGQIMVDLIDTAFDETARYGLISPASKIKSGTTTELIIKASFSKRFGENEYRKWDNLVTVDQKVAVNIVSPDYTTRNANTVIQSINRNTIAVDPPLPFTPQADDIMILSKYDNAETTEQIKLIYTFMTDNAAFPDGGSPYKMI